MPASLSAVRDGIKARLDTITGLRAYDTIPGQVMPPAAVVAPAPGVFLDYDTTMARGSDDMFFVVTLLVSDAVDRAAQDALDGYLAGTGAGSVKTAIEADRTLGGVSQFVTVEDALGYGLIEYNGIQYFGCRFSVAVGV